MQNWLYIALLSLIFAYYSNKLNGEKHICNSKVTPTKPALYSNIGHFGVHEILRATQDFHSHVANKASGTGNARHDCKAGREETVSSRTLAEL